MEISIQVNGRTVKSEVEPRMLLSDFIRERAGMTGTNVGCEQGVCGACTVHLDGEPVRSCLLFAVQARGRAVRTVEDLERGGAHGDGASDAAEGEALHPLQQAFHERHALQCGFCTPGFLMSIVPELPAMAEMDDEQLRQELGGNICRCTGYKGIVEAIRLASTRIEGRDFDPIGIDRPAVVTEDGNE